MGGEILPHPLHIQNASVPDFSYFRAFTPRGTSWIIHPVSQKLLCFFYDVCRSFCQIWHDGLKQISPLCVLSCANAYAILMCFDSKCEDLERQSRVVVTMFNSPFITGRVKRQYNLNVGAVSENIRETFITYLLVAWASANPDHRRRCQENK